MVVAGTVLDAASAALLAFIPAQVGFGRHRPASRRKGKAEQTTCEAHEITAIVAAAVGLFQHSNQFLEWA
jgi:hypothetical protein